MGKFSDKTMNDREANRMNTDQRTLDVPQTGNSSNKNEEAVSSFRCLDRTTSSCSEGQMSHLAASTSSPSLLDGCSNSSTHIGANIERHVQTHNVQIVTGSCSPPLSPIPVSPGVTPEVVPLLSVPPSREIPPDSVFLTPALPRAVHTVHERPSSAPANYLEKISGTLLRLVGDHYLCSACGRQLRTIGDQLTMETNINHIRRALSATHLNVNENDD